MKSRTSSDKWSRFVIGFSVGAKSGDLQSKVGVNPFGEHSMNYIVLWVGQQIPSQLCVLFTFHYLKPLGQFGQVSESLDLQSLNWYNWHSSNNSQLTVQKWRLRWVKAEGQGPGYRSGLTESLLSFCQGPCPLS